LVNWKLRVLAVDRQEFRQYEEESFAMDR